jgi:hypothetical protein
MYTMMSGYSGMIKKARGSRPAGDELPRAWSLGLHGLALPAAAAAGVVPMAMVPVAATARVGIRCHKGQSEQDQNDLRH